MDREQRRRWTLAGGVVLMLVALFSYLATLDESDPSVLPETEQQIGQGVE